MPDVRAYSFVASIRIAASAITTSGEAPATRETRRAVVMIVPSGVNKGRGGEARSVLFVAAMARGVTNF